MFELILCLLLPQQDIRKGIELSRAGDHEASEAVLKPMKSSVDPAYAFYRLVNAFKLNQKEEGMKWADNIIYAFTDYPQRYKDLAIIMKAEMETWDKDPKSLDDIAREMTKVQDRLKNNKGGPQTQKMQKEIADRLEKMIQDMEDKKDKKDKDKDKDKENQDSDGSGKGKERRASQSGSSSPPNDTHNANDGGTGEVTKKKIKEIAEVWGKLPEKERAKALVGLLKTVPAKDKAVIERYLQELQKRSGKK